MIRLSACSKSNRCRKERGILTAEKSRVDEVYGYNEPASFFYLVIVKYRLGISSSSSRVDDVHNPLRRNRRTDDERNVNPPRHPKTQDREFLSRCPEAKRIGDRIRLVTPKNSVNTLSLAA